MRIDRARDRNRDRDRDRDRGGLLFLAGATRDARRRRKAPKISPGRRAVESGGARAFARGPPRTSQRLTCFWMTSAARASSASGESLTPRRFDAEPYPSANAMSVNADMMARDRGSTRARARTPRTPARGEPEATLGVTKPGGAPAWTVATRADADETTRRNSVECRSHQLITHCARHRSARGSSTGLFV